MQQYLLGQVHTQLGLTISDSDQSKEIHSVRVCTGYVKYGAN